MKIYEIILEAKKSEAPKPRNFVAKHAKTAGAGAHKDKKKAAKQGDVKHKGKVMAEAGFVDVTSWSPSRVQAMGRADDDGIGSYTSRNKPNLIAWVFYNVKPGQEDQAATLNIRKLKSGKWAMPVYDKSGATYRFQRNKADQVFGPGKRWDIKNEQSTVAETATAGATSAANVSVGAVYKNKPGKTPKNKDGTAKNALDMKANLLTGGSIKR